MPHRVGHQLMTQLLATQILYFGPFRGVMKIRIAVNLVVLGNLPLTTSWTQ